MNFDDVTECVRQEREYQKKKAIKENWDQNKSIGEFLLIIESELNEAKAAYCKGGEGRNSLGHELIQIMAVVSEALERIDPQWKDNYLMLSGKEFFDDAMKENI